MRLNIWSYVGVPRKFDDCWKTIVSDCFLQGRVVKLLVRLHLADILDWGSSNQDPQPTNQLVGWLVGFGRTEAWLRLSTALQFKRTLYVKSEPGRLIISFRISFTHFTLALTAKQSINQQWFSQKQIAF